MHNPLGHHGRVQGTSRLFREDDEQVCHHSYKNDPIRVTATFLVRALNVLFCAYDRTARINFAKTSLSIRAFDRSKQSNDLHRCDHRFHFPLCNFIFVSREFLLT